MERGSTTVEDGDPVEIPGGHCAFLSQPRALTEALVQAWADTKRS
jgi:hypothetical protein